MTFTGKPSRACENCSLAHVKCDAGRPRCSRCVRLNKNCGGAKRDIDLIFRFEDGKAKLPKLKARGPQDPHSTENGVTCRFPLSPLYGHNRGNVESPSQLCLLSSFDDQAFCYFYESTVGTLSKFDYSLDLHSQLPTLLSRTQQKSVLYLASRAISHATYSRIRDHNPQSVKESRRYYIQAISALKRVIRNPVEAIMDETLYAVLLLCGYETIMFDQESRSAWDSHVDGAVALLRARGRQKLVTPLECNMFLFVRRNAINSHAQIARPVDPIFDDISGDVASHMNVEDQLLSKTIKVPLLQSQANDILSQKTQLISERTTSDLIKAAKKLDHELVQWARAVPVEWHYSVSTNMRPTYNPGSKTTSYTLHQLHQYPDFYVARVWNLYRVSRLIIQSIIMRITECRSCDREVNISDIERLNIKLVSDVCASVPFLLGYDVAELKNKSLVIHIHEDMLLWPQSSMTNLKKPSKHTGRFSLIWPLHLSSSVSAIPERQKEWMRAQLRWIAENGETQARLVCQASSQTLLGKAEDFRFDCI